MTDEEILKIGDSFYIPIYTLRYPEQSKTIVDIKCHCLKVSDVITTTNSKGTKVTYIGNDRYKYNSKRIFTKPFTEEHALNILKKYVKYRNNLWGGPYYLGEYIHD